MLSSNRDSLDRNDVKSPVVEGACSVERNSACAPWRFKVGPPMRIDVELPTDRARPGKLTLKDDQGHVLAGPFDVLGKADNGRAAQEGNPTRDSTRSYGDTPTGTYT